MDDADVVALLQVPAAAVRVPCVCRACARVRACACCAGERAARVSVLCACACCALVRACVCACVWEGGRLCACVRMCRAVRARINVRVRERVTGRMPRVNAVHMRACVCAVARACAQCASACMEARAVRLRVRCRLHVTARARARRRRRHRAECVRRRLGQRVCVRAHAAGVHTGVTRSAVGGCRTPCHEPR
jgi:hypothetical protein